VVDGVGSGAEEDGVGEAMIQVRVLWIGGCRDRCSVSRGDTVCGFLGNQQSRTYFDGHVCHNITIPVGVWMTTIRQSNVICFNIDMR